MVDLSRKLKRRVINARRKKMSFLELPGNSECSYMIHRLAVWMSMFVGVKSTPLRLVIVTSSSEKATS